MTHTPAPALTAEELAVVARFEAAPYPAEVTEAHLESVRAAMAPSQAEESTDCGCGVRGCVWGHGA